MLHNPAYAGAYVYGRRPLRPGEMPATPSKPRTVPREEWEVCLRDAHPGYLSWEAFLKNQERLEQNRCFRPQEQRGAAREGAALLQGIVRCGECGRRMQVQYPQGGNGRYVCQHGHYQHAGRRCQTLLAHPVDGAVAKTFLEAMIPAQLEVSLATLQELEARAHQIERAWELERERARYEAELARRRFELVEPLNRLVARSLEREWNQKLLQLEQWEREAALASRVAPCCLTAPERERVLSLARDLPRVWEAKTTSHAQRKQLLRLLIAEVTVTRGERGLTLWIRWQTGAVTELEVSRGPKGYERNRTDPEVVERIRELCVKKTDRQIAAMLNEEKRTTGVGGAFTAMKVRSVRAAHGIETGCPEQALEVGR